MVAMRSHAAPPRRERPRRALRSWGTALLVLLAAWTGFAPGTSSQGGSEVADFKRHFKDLKRKADRVEAIFSLDKVQGPEAAEALVPVLARDEDPDVRSAAIRVLTNNKDPRAVDTLAAALRKQGPAVRPGLCQVLGEIRCESARSDLERLLKEGDFLVKYRAIEALGSIGNPASVPAVASFLKDGEPELRIAAVDALARMRADDAAPQVVAALQDREWRVRAAAIRALATLRTKDALEPLVKIASGDEGRLVDDACQTLKALSGRDFGREYATWKTWYEREAKDPAYKLPTADEIAKIEARKLEAPKAGETGVIPARKITEFLGVTTPSKKIMFIIDCSGSMEDLVIEKDRYRGQNYPGFRKIDIVKEELARTIQRLDTTTEFSIVTFATKIKPWKRGQLVPANSINKAAAIEYARSLEPIGGSSKAELASAGLGSAAALGEGKTNTYGALMYGLGNPVRGVVEKGAGTEIDTVFFLSDGKPSHGDLVDTDEILAAVKEANHQKRIALHVLAIGDFDKGFMRRLATDNGGVFVDLGK